MKLIPASSFGRSDMVDRQVTGKDAMTSVVENHDQKPTTVFLGSVAASAACVQMVTTWSLVCGVSQASNVMLVLSAAVGCLLAAKFCPAVFRYSTQSSLSTASAVVLGMLLMLAAWSAPLVFDQLLVLGTSVAGNSVWLAFAFPAAIVMLVTIAIGLWAARLDDAQHRTATWRLPGLAIGCLPALIQIFTTIPMFVPVLVAIFAALVALVIDGRSVRSHIQQTETPQTSSRPEIVQGTSWGHVASIIGSGVLLHMVARTVGLLFPLSHAVFCVAGFLTLAAFSACRFRPVQKLVDQVWYVPGMLLLTAATPVVADRLIDFNLYLNATTSSPWLMLLLRALQLTAFTLVATAPWHRRLASDAGMQTMSLLPALLSGLGVGMLMNGVSLSWELVAGIGLASAPLFFVRRSSDAVDSTATTAANPNTTTNAIAAGPVWQHRLAAIVPCAIAVTMSVIGPFSAADSALLLFNARSAQGYRLGLDRGMILQSHSTRLLQQHNTNAGHVTIWRTSGEQLQMRRDGFPAGQATGNALITPQPVTETLTAVIPLVLHKKPGSIMLLGDDFGVGLRACCNFPVHTILAVRKDAASTAAAEEFVWSSLEQSPLQDDRVTVSHQPVVTAVRQSKNRTWDAIVADSPAITSLSGQEQFTESFYRHVKSQLTESGVFCQRIIQHDLGSEPLLRITSTVTDVFGRAVLVRMAPGEIAIVATRTPPGREGVEILDAGVLQRLARSHVGRELARSGWDWSQVAALPTIDTAGPVALFDNAKKLPSATAANAHFAFAMPIEAGRWADKASELGQTFGASSQRLADAMPGRKNYDEFARRYSAVVQQLEILTSFPDEPWTYRKSLRTELQRSPRPPLEEVRDGRITRKAHPLDEFRKNYFVSLGKVLQQCATGHVDSLLLRQLAEFTSQYEPLLSNFAHHELVRVHELTAHPAPALELRHRLHTVYFTEGGDLSVRQLANAMEQILDDPELLPNDQQRFDHVNSMLQELVRRWEGRRGYEPPSARRTQRDVDICIHVANRALNQMEDWSAAANLTSDDLRRRRRFINDALISPLRKYGETVLAHRIKSESPTTDVALDDGSNDMPLLLNSDSVNTN